PERPLHGAPSDDRRRASSGSPSDDRISGASPARRTRRRPVILAPPLVRCRDASDVQTLSSNPGRRPAVLATTVLVVVAAGLVGGRAFERGAPSPASASDADGREPSHGAPKLA